MVRQGPDPAAGTESQIAFETQPRGDTRVELRIEGHSVSRLFVVPFTLRIGAANVRMDGIGGVETEKEWRHRGYSRRVLEATLERMGQGDAALSMLYGIADFYPKFGYATAGPDHSIELAGSFQEAVLPEGWRVRPFAISDLPTLCLLYEQSTAHGVGAAVRRAGTGPWAKLSRPDGHGAEECRVVEAPDGQIRGYAWRARWHWYVSNWERNDPEAMVIAEALADGPVAADAILAMCRLWAAEENGNRPQPAKRLILALPPEGPVAAAAMYQRSTVSRRYQRCGGSMVRVVDAERLLRAMKPELANRLQAAGSSFAGALRFQTEIGEAVMRVTSEGVAVEGARVSGAASGEIAIRLPQTALARLALGAFPPDDVLSRLDDPPDQGAWQIIQTLFPLRHPHMSLPDRF